MINAKTAKKNVNEKLKNDKLSKIEEEEVRRKEQLAKKAAIQKIADDLVKSGIPELDNVIKEASKEGFSKIDLRYNFLGFEPSGYGLAVDATQTVIDYIKSFGYYVECEYRTHTSSSWDRDYPSESYTEAVIEVSWD